MATPILADQVGAPSPHGTPRTVDPGLISVRDDICRNAAHEIAAISDMLRGQQHDADDYEYLARGALLRVRDLAEAIIFTTRSSFDKAGIAEGYETVYGDKLLTLLGEELGAANG